MLSVQIFTITDESTNILADAFYSFISSLNFLGSWNSLTPIFIILGLLISMMLSSYRYEAVRLELISQSNPSGHKDNLIAKLEFQLSKKPVYSGNIYAQHWRVANAHLTYRDKFRVYRAVSDAKKDGSLISSRFELKDNDIKIYETRMRPGGTPSVIIAGSTNVLIDVIKIYG
jgi:hypothetical protein